MNFAFALLIAVMTQVGGDPLFSDVPPSPGDQSPGAQGLNGDSRPYPSSIFAQNDRQIPALVEGQLILVNVREGSQVRQGDILATQDDRQAAAAVEVADLGFKAADERAKDRIEEVYARLSADVARLDYQSGLDANARNPGVNAISPIDLEKKRLDWNRARLQEEKAKKDQVLARLEADVKDAEKRAAEVALGNRTIRAPFDGEVQLMRLHQSEWANPGDPILRLVQFDVMYVQTHVSASDYDPVELQGRPVTVAINLARGRQASVQGHVVYVDQVAVETDEGQAEYIVRAEVKNQREGDFWLVRPGLPSTMTIHVTQPVLQSASR